MCLHDLNERAKCNNTDLEIGTVFYTKNTSAIWQEDGWLGLVVNGKLQMAIFIRMHQRYHRHRVCSFCITINVKFMNMNM